MRRPSCGRGRFLSAARFSNSNRSGGSRRLSDNRTQYGSDSGAGMGVGRRISFAVKNSTDFRPEGGLMGSLLRSSIDLTLEGPVSFVWHYGSIAMNMQESYL
jgi:hypothetical protein